MRTGQRNLAQGSVTGIFLLSHFDEFTFRPQNTCARRPPVFLVSSPVGDCRRVIVDKPIRMRGGRAVTCVVLGSRPTIRIDPACIWAIQLSFSTPPLPSPLYSLTTPQTLTDFSPIKAPLAARVKHQLNFQILRECRHPCLRTLSQRSPFSLIPPRTTPYLSTF